jgi:hypothetical protein
MHKFHDSILSVRYLPFYCTAVGCACHHLTSNLRVVPRESLCEVLEPQCARTTVLHVVVL